MDDFTKKLRRAVARNNLSLVDCAKLFDASIPSVQRWLDGETVPAIAYQKVIDREIAKLDGNKGERNAKHLA